MKKVNKSFVSKTIIYEMHVRDFTSLHYQNLKSYKDSFKALIEVKAFEYLHNLSINYAQLLPIQATYTVDDSDRTILLKNMGKSKHTNYNWGYDSHNYFAINNWYGSDFHNPYATIEDLRAVVDNAHANNVEIILDVVYNHVKINQIFDNILLGYYFRNQKPYPVDQPPLASERLMVRKLIIDSLIYLVKNFQVDGFRFDLSSFLDLTTLNEITLALRKINPAIILHGEAWKFTNLDYSQSWIKGMATHEVNFAYFNDTTRIAIRGYNQNDKVGLGLINANLNYFKPYLCSVIGNLKTHQFHSQSWLVWFVCNKFRNDLQYCACHDGLTLWDKINATSNQPLFEKLSLYRQALMLQFCTQGRQLILGGTELLQSKPNDQSGQR